MSFSRYVKQPKVKVGSVDKAPTIDYGALAQAEFGVPQPKPQPKPDRFAGFAAADAGSLDTYQPWRNTVNIAGSNINLDNSVEQIADDIAKAFYGSAQTPTPVPTGGGGGGVNTAAAIEALRQVVANAGAGDIDYGALSQAATERYGGYGVTLDEMLAEASGRMTSAADTARKNIGNLAPTTVYDPAMASMGLGSGAGYLASLGVSDADVRAVKAFEDQMLADRLARATGFSQRVADVEAANRAERQAAIETILQSGVTGLSGMEAYNRAAIANALAAEQERLKELERAQTQAREQAILEARLAAAELGGSI